MWGLAGRRAWQRALLFALLLGLVRLLWHTDLHQVVAVAPRLISPASPNAASEPAARAAAPPATGH